jgi:hypothetical protein
MKPRHLSASLLLAGAIAMASSSSSAAAAAVGPIKLVDPTRAKTTRVFASGFENTADFAGFYVTPDTSTTHVASSNEVVHSGSLASKGWITGPTSASDPDGPNHRGYPTVQLWKLRGGGFRRSVIIDMYVWVDASLRPG